jgi:UDP-N-acetylmuramoyl-L-alanyl-D-glutamate--2,6-diaminopimelate ligase
VNLGDLLGRSGVGSPEQLVAAVAVTGVTQRADEVRPGDLFICRRGALADGHDHARDAVERGAAALLVERCLPLAVPQVVVRDTAGAVPALAAAFWDHPSRCLDLVGVTGTNGKTTTTYLIRSILELHGWPTGLIGTLSSSLTTPEPVELQSRLAGFVADGCRAVAMEVSSHGLAQGRVDRTWFAAGVFTNLDRDHLDHHGDQRSYFEAKARLFSPERIGFGVVNRDDEWGRELLRRGGPPWSRTAWPMPATAAGRRSRGRGSGCGCHSSASSTWSTRWRPRRRAGSWASPRPPSSRR